MTETSSDIPLKNQSHIYFSGLEIKLNYLIWKKVN